MKTTEKLSPLDLHNHLDSFMGTFGYHSHSIGNLQLNLTDGCDFLRVAAECFWLFDAILSHQTNQKVKEQSFQVWKLQKQEDNTWLLQCEDGNKGIVTVQKIEYSDFPLNQIIIWVVDGVAMLPSEY